MRPLDPPTSSQQLLQTLLLVGRHIAAELRRAYPALLPAHLALLGRLEHSPATLSELAAEHGVSLQTLSNSVTLLVERGWVKRTQAAADRRRWLLELTPAGRLVAHAAQAKVEARMAEHLDSLSKTDQAKLRAGLDVLRRVFELTEP